MPNPNPRRNYAIDWVRRLAGLGTQTVESASAITGVVTDTPATGSVSGDVTGALLGPLYVQGIHGDEIGRVLAADVNDWDPSGSDALIWDVDFAGFGIRGILAPTVPGEVHIIRAISAGTLYHEDAGSTDVNRLTTASDTDISLTIDSSVVIVYSGTTNRWQVVGGAGGGGGSIAGKEDGSTVVATASAVDVGHGLDGSDEGGGVFGVAVDETELDGTLIPGVAAYPKSCLNIPINGRGLVIATGIANFAIRIKGTYNVLGWAVYNDGSGAATVDVWKVAHASYPPTSGNSIVGTGTKPNVTGGNRMAAGDVSDWTGATALSDGDVLIVNVTANATNTFLNVALDLERIGS